MATRSSSRDETPRRPLPKLVPLEPAAGSSDDTPRTGRSEDSARQRRRAQQRLIRDSTPEVDESVSRPAKKEVRYSTCPDRFWICLICLIGYHRFRYHLDQSNRKTVKYPNVEKRDDVFNPRSFISYLLPSLSDVDPSVIDLNYRLNHHYCKVSKMK